MKLTILEKHSQPLSYAMSKFDTALEDAQENFVPRPNIRDRHREELFKAIDNHLSDINERGCRIGEDIEKFKRSEGLL